MAGKKQPDSLIFVSVGLRPKEWAHVMRFKPGDASETRCLSELVARTMKLWPAERPVPDPSKPEKLRSRRRIPGAVASYAERNGVTRNDALAEIAARYIAEHPEQFQGIS